MTAPSTLAALGRATAFIAATGVEPDGSILVLDGRFIARYERATEAEADELIGHLGLHLADARHPRCEYADGIWTLITSAWSRLTHDEANVSVRRPVEAVAR